MRQKFSKLGAMLLAFTLLVTSSVVTVPAKTHTLGSSLANQMLGARTCEYNNRIYYAYDDEVYSIKKDGTNKKTEFTMPEAEGCNGFSHITILDGRVYAIFDFYGGSDATDSQLISFTLNADSADYENHGSAVSVHAVDGRIYYTKSKVSKDKLGFLYSENIGIYVMNADGSEEKALVNKNDCYLLGTDGTAIYYRAFNNKTKKTDFCRCDMNGKNRKKLYSGSIVTPFMADGSYIYYSHQDYQQTASGSTWITTIYRRSIKGGTAKKMYSCKGGITNFYVDGTTMYVSTFNKGLIRVNLKTGKSKLLNKHTGAGICSVYGGVMVFEQHRMDMDNGTDIDMILARTSTGKKIKKIGAYFVS